MLILFSVDLYSGYSVLSWLSCPGGSAVAVLSWWFCRGCPVTPAKMNIKLRRCFLVALKFQLGTLSRRTIFGRDTIIIKIVLLETFFHPQPI
jgi:hypothetical protein